MTREYGIKPKTILRWLKQLEEGKLSEGKVRYDKEFREKTLELYQALKNAREVARRRNISEGSVIRWLKEANIEIYKGTDIKFYGCERISSKYLQEVVDKCLGFCIEIKNVSKVSKQTAISVNTIKSWMKKIRKKNKNVA